MKSEQLTCGVLDTERVHCSGFCTGVVFSWFGFSAFSSSCFLLGGVGKGWLRVGWSLRCVALREVKAAVVLLIKFNRIRQEVNPQSSKKAYRLTPSQCGSARSTSLHSRIGERKGGLCLHFNPQYKTLD